MLDAEKLSDSGLERAGHGDRDYGYARWGRDERESRGLLISRWVRVVVVGAMALRQGWLPEHRVARPPASAAFELNRRHPTPSALARLAAQRGGVQARPPGGQVGVHAL